MKKAVVLGMILLALGTLAYAEGATVGFGWGRTTFTLAAGNSVNSDITQGWGLADFPLDPRANLDFAWSGDFTAFKITGYLNGIALAFVNSYGTLKLMPDMFSVMIGQFNGDGWDAFRKTSPHPIHDVNNKNVGRFGGWGIIADIAPKDSGFEAAVMYRTADPTGTGAPGLLAPTAANTNFGASYTLPNLLKIAAGSTDDAINAGGGRNIFGRVELLMVPSLTLWADVKYTGLDVQPTVSNIKGELAAAYDMKPLTIVFAGTFANYDDDFNTTTDLFNPAIKMQWAVYPEVYYNLGAFTLGLFASVAGDDVANSGIAYGVEPYVKLNDFNTRISFVYASSTATGATSSWRIPVMIDWGF